MTTNLPCGCATRGERRWLCTYHKGQASERAEIIAWLQYMATGMAEPMCDEWGVLAAGKEERLKAATYAEAARAIEAGVHLKGGEK